MTWLLRAIAAARRERERSARLARARELVGMQRAHLGLAIQCVAIALKNERESDVREELYRRLVKLQADDAVLAESDYARVIADRWLS